MALRGHSLVAALFALTAAALPTEHERLLTRAHWNGSAPRNGLAYKRNPHGRYMPHQGERECRRRRQQARMGRIRNILAEAR